MKTIIFSGTALLIVLGISLMSVQDADAQNVYYSTAESASISPTMAEVKGVVDEFGRMWETQDMDMFDHLVANDADIVVIGTDRAEILIGFDDYREARQRQFESFDNIEYNVQKQTIRISDHGKVAWFTKIYDMFLMDASEQPLTLDGIRVSGVVELHNGDWKIVHLHTSLPVEGQAAEY